MRRTLLISLLLFWCYTVKNINGVDWCSIACFRGTHIVCKRPHCMEKNCTLVEGVSEELKKDVVRWHNLFRDRFARALRASNVKEMEWDSDLEFVATCQALTCSGYPDQCRNTPNFPYKPSEGKFGVGQNIYYHFNQQVVEANELAAEGLTEWYSQYEYVANHVYKRFKMKENYKHFTQMMWAKTSDVGCAWTYSEYYNTYFYLFYCNYGPTGNIAGEPTFKPGVPATNCPRGWRQSTSYTALCKRTNSSITFVAPSIVFQLGIAILLSYILD